MRRPPAVARVLRTVTQTIRRHEMVRPGDLVLVSVSGGPDSVCLLYSLWFLRRLLQIRLAVFHLDHRLRPGSPADAVYVRRLAARLGLPCHLRVADGAPPPGSSVEAWARDQRIAHRAEVAREIGSGRVAEGHTLDDDAETLLIGLIRGGGMEALDGIAPVSGLEIQPLIEVRRSDVEAFCRALRLRPRLDPTNEDPRFLRNAIRLGVIPEIERAVGRDVREPLARTAGLLRADQAELMRLVVDAWADVVDGGWRPDVSDGLALRAEPLARLSDPIAGRLIGQAIFRFGIPATRADVRSVADLARGRPGRRCDLSGGLKARREREYVRLSLPRTRSGRA